MHRWLRITLKVAAILVGLFFLVWAALAWYIDAHKDELLKDINSQLSKNMGGSLQIESMQPSLIVTFPYFSVSLHNVTLHDSLWQYHHHDLFAARRVYVQLNPLSLLRRKPRIHEVMVRDASIYIFTDSTGYSNKYLLQRRDTTRPANKHIVFQRLQLQNTKITFEDKIKHKLFQLDVRNSLGVVNYKSSGWDMDLRMNTRVNEFNFNTDKGSFLKDETLRGHLKLNYTYDNHELHIPAQQILIGQDPIGLKGTFSFADKVPVFQLEFSASRIAYHNAARLVSPNIQRHLDSFDLSKPVSIHALINGRVKYRDTPSVKVDWQVNNNNLSTPIGPMEHCSFQGFFNNNVVPGLGHNDHNSAIVLYNIHAHWALLPFTADSIKVVDLKQPVLSFHIKADFPIRALNLLTESETFSFDTGRANADISYKGALDPNDTALPSISGDFHIINAGITYAPRNLSFTKCNATLHFTDSVLYMNDVRATNGKSTLLMQGTVHNYVNFYYNSSANILFDWQINSPFLDLNTFSSFISRRRRAKAAAGKYRNINNIARQLDDMLDQSDVHMMVHINKMFFHRFNATDINADVTLKESDIKLGYVDLNNSGGKLALKGDIIQQGNDKHFSLSAGIDKVKVDQLFYSFENFGQDAIDAKNIGGTLSAQAQLSGNITDTGNLVPSSLQGYADFDMDSGELIHFDPLANIGKYAFKRRNLGDVTFGKLKGRFDINEGKIIINPMVIRSSAINFKVEGVYAPPKGTDISLEVPLRNPKKEDLNNVDTQNNDQWRTGIVLYLKAVSGNDGKVHIGWDRSKGFLKNIKKKKKKKKWR